MTTTEPRVLARRAQDRPVRRSSPRPADRQARSDACLTALERAAAAAVLIGAGCEGRQSALDPRGPQADALFDLWNVMLIGGAVIFAVVVGLAIAAVGLPRRTLDDPPAQERHGLRAVIAGTVATAAILVALTIYNVATSRDVYASSSESPPLAIRVVGHRWWWEVVYPGEPASHTVRTANELWIPVGQPVEVTLASRDVIHSFWAPNLQGKMDAIPGRTTTVRFQADTPGVYRGQCAEFCGLQHAKMAFEIVAVEPAEFSRWLDRQRQPADDPDTELAQRGRDELVRACGVCHTVRGTTAMAAVAPDLTHVASRRTIAAGVLPNHRGQLAGWITDPQHVKPGTMMPGIELEADALHAVLAYLESLR